MDDMGIHSKDAIISEYEVKHQEKVQIIKCGKILWRSIIYGLYMLLAIIVI